MPSAFLISYRLNVSNCSVMELEPWGAEPFGWSRSCTNVCARSLIYVSGTIFIYHGSSSYLNRLFIDKVTNLPKCTYIISQEETQVYSYSYGRSCSLLRYFIKTGARAETNSFGSATQSLCPVSNGGEFSSRSNRKPASVTLPSFQSLLRSRNSLFRLQLRLEKSSGFGSEAVDCSTFSFEGTCVHSFSMKM
jgi:hypothetical protein